MKRQAQSWIPSAFAVATSLDQETVLLNARTGRYFVLDEVGQRMWELLLELGRVEPVVQTLAEEYDATDTQLEHDLLDLIDELEQNGLLCKTTQESQTSL